ncbi:lipase family protein [Lewinella cohaerens]|uniref:lipase family protein n=1 Tax=Lewinella cohaerens TaxID=70995 RepID=UPI00036C314F|nr:hypothetical protein [Lewinella cohaerens]
MKNPTPFVFNKTFFFLLFGIIFFTACDPATTITDPQEGEEITELGPATPPPSEEAVRQFFYAWMADCANDQYYSSDFKAREDAFKYLRGLAETRIDNAIKDATAIGESTRVWGPAINITYEDDTDDGYFYIIENLIYCTYAKVGGVSHYYVGIAGTNAISEYDWLHEDVNEGTVNNPTTGGKISKGSLLGLEQLTALKDSVQGITLLSFLQEKISEDSTAVISVAGHSLGGALTQVYAGYLNNKLGANVNVEAWVYAGPTAGDSTFAQNLVQNLKAENYHAYNNALDVVPHVWQIDSLNKICSIYEEESYCKFGIEENPLVSLVGEYLKTISVNGNYTIPIGQNHVFTKSLTPASLDDCADFFTASMLEISKVDGYSVPYTLIPNLTKLNSLCKVGSSNAQDVNLRLLMFLAKMAEEHTTAYIDYFFQGEYSSLKSIVAEYTAAPTDDTKVRGNAEEGVDILNAFLTNVHETMKSKNPTCKCGS